MAPPPSSESVDPNTALNGAQVQSMVTIVEAVAARQLPRETGVALIVAAFPVSPEEADQIMGEVGRTFFAQETPDPADPATPEPKPTDPKAA